MRTARLCLEMAGRHGWGEPLTCSGNFLLRLAACPGKDLIAEARRAALVAGRSMRAPGKSLLYQSRNCAVESTDRHACLSEAVPHLDLSCSACHSIEPGAQLVLLGVASPRSFSARSASAF